MKPIPVASPTLGKLEEKYVSSCIKSTWISSKGKFIQKFEKKFADFFCVKYATSASNGTVALHLALAALGISPGDEVILPVLTFVACANAVRYVGATPVFVDIDPKTGNLDPQLIEKKITRKTKAILVVHLYGYPADMAAILTPAKKHGLFVIEDCAQAHGAEIKLKTQSSKLWKKVGSIGDVGCFSFYGNKIITTGEGGMITTSSKTLYKKINLLKNHGMSEKSKYFHPVVGYNYRLTNLQAAVGYAQMQRLPSLLKKRAKIEKIYRQKLSNVPGLVFQPKNPQIKNVCWLFSMLVTSKFKLTRDQLIKQLAKHNIETRPFFFPLTAFPMYQTQEKFPVADKISRQGINLPTSANLSLSCISSMCKIIRKLTLCPNQS